jgi:hypothetical protein
MSIGDQKIDYKTHILIGVRPTGIMTVLADWPNVPPQSEVQQAIDRTHEPYVSFVLCTPTSVMPAQAPTPARIGFGLPGRRR